MIENEYHFLLICPSYTELRNTHIPRYYRTWPTITKSKLLINTNSEIKIRNLATFLHHATVIYQCVPILCIIALCKYLPCFSCFVHAFHAFHIYCLWRWTCLFMPHKIVWLFNLNYHSLSCIYLSVEGHTIICLIAYINRKPVLIHQYCVGCMLVPSPSP